MGEAFLDKQASCHQRDCIRFREYAFDGTRLTGIPKIDGETMKNDLFCCQSCVYFDRLNLFTEKDDADSKH
uniref:Uncharacterized protein n=1 Tax=viral metagenome TaxID=1070528 RepID=A0A6M3KQP0_9ZZZZ